MLAQCDFCKEFSGDTKNAFHRLYRDDLVGRVLVQSEHHAVIPSLGQIVEGYLLVVPLDHFRSLGELRGDVLDDFVFISDMVGRALKTLYGPYIFFEHGVRSEHAGGCGISHAHLHAMPLSGAPDPLVALRTKFPHTKLGRMAEIGQESAGFPSYLLLQDSHGDLYLFDTGPLPSQYMRQVLADSLHETNWDWRKAGREERLLSTIRRLSEHFAAFPDLKQHLDAPR